MRRYASASCLHGGPCYGNADHPNHSSFSGSTDLVGRRKCPRSDVARRLNPGHWSQFIPERFTPPPNSCVPVNRTTKNGGK